MSPCNVVSRPAGAKPARPRVSPPEPGASLAPIPEMGLAMRRHASVRAVGRRPRNRESSRMPRGLDHLEGHNDLCVQWARRGASPAGCSTMARTRGRPRNLGGPRLPSTHPGFTESRRPVSDARHVAGARVVGPRGIAQAPASREATGKGNWSRGPWGQGVGGLQRRVGSGHGMAAGPGRAKAARVGVHCRREACPVPGPWSTCHRDLCREWSARNAHPKDGSTRWHTGLTCQP